MNKNKFSNNKFIYRKMNLVNKCIFKFFFDHDFFGTEDTDGKTSSRNGLKVIVFLEVKL